MMYEVVYWSNGWATGIVGWMSDSRWQTPEEAFMAARGPALAIVILRFK